MCRYQDGKRPPIGKYEFFVGVCLAQLSPLHEALIIIVSFDLLPKGLSMPHPPSSLPAHYSHEPAESATLAPPTSRTVGKGGGRTRLITKHCTASQWHLHQHIDPCLACLALLLQFLSMKRQSCVPKAFAMLPFRNPHTHNRFQVFSRTLHQRLLDYSMGPAWYERTLSGNEKEIDDKHVWNDGGCFGLSWSVSSE
jgi:hypothetical protein